MLISLDKIKVRQRVRADLGDLEALMDSIKTYGLMSPLVIDKDNYLIAGGRRLEALKRLGVENAEVRVVDADSEVRALEMEMEENNQRKAFTQDELLVGYERLESLRHPSAWKRFLKFLGRVKAWFCSLFKRKKKN